MHHRWLRPLLLALLFLAPPRPTAGAEDKPPDPYAEATEAQKATWETMAKTVRGLVWSGRYAEALAQLEDADDPSALALKIDILTETGRDAEALRVAADALEKHPEHPALLAARGDALLVTGQYARAAADYETAMADRGTDPAPGQMRARLALADLHHRLARREDWLATTDRFFECYDPNQDEAYTAPEVYYIGAGAIVGEDYRNGFPVMALAQEKDETFLPVYVRLGEIYVEKYEYPNAAREFGDALKLNPRHPAAHAGLGGVFIHERNFSEVEVHAAKALETNPRYVPAMLLRARVDFLDERNEAALAHLEAAAAINPRDPEVLSFRAVIAILREDQAAFEAIQEELLAAYDVLPSADDAAQARVRQNGLARLYVEISHALVHRRSEELALPWARKAAEADPENARAHARLGISLMRHGLEEEAATPLAEAFRLDPFNVRVYNLRQLLRQDEHYRRLSTERFRVKLYKSDADILQPYVERMVETMLTTCEQRFGYTVPKDVRLAIMHSQSAFAARVTGLPTLHAAGATTGPFVALVSPSDFKASGRTHNWESTLLHEIAHVVTLMGSSYRIPRWLTEGMSVYMQDNTRSIRDIPFKTMVEHGPLPELATWNREFTRPEYAWRVPAAYEAAGLFVTWLVAEHGPEVLGRLVHLYSEGKTTAEVFQEALGQDLPAVDTWFHERLKAYADTVQCPVMEDPRQVEKWEKLYEANPENTLASLRLLRIYRRHNPEKAWALAEELMQRAQKLADEGNAGAGDRAFALAGVIAAGAALRGNAPDKAARLSKLTLLVDPGNAHAEYFLGLVEIQKDNRAAAEERLASAIRLYPRFVHETPLGNPYHALAKLRLDQDDRAGAAEILEAYCGIHADDAGALRKLAELYSALGQTEQAIATYRRLVGIDPYEAEDHEAFAKLLADAGRADAATRERTVAAACRKRSGDAAAATRTEGPELDAEDQAPAPASEPEPAPEPESPEMDPGLKKFLKGL